MFTNTAIERTVADSLIVGLVEVLMIGSFTLLNARQLTANNASVVHTLDVLSELESLLTTALEAETNQRSYVITGDEDFLEPYTAALSRLDSQLDRIATLTSDSPEQQARIERLRPLFTQRIERLWQTITLRDEQGLDAAVRKVAKGAGTAISEEIQTLIAEMQAEENTLLAQHSVAAENSTRFAVVLPVILFVGLLALLAMGYVMV